MRAVTKVYDSPPSGHQRERGRSKPSNQSRESDLLIQKRGPPVMNFRLLFRKSMPGELQFFLFDRILRIEWLTPYFCSNKPPRSEAGFNFAR